MDNIQTLLKRLARFKRYVDGSATPPQMLIDAERRLIDQAKNRLTAEELLKVLENPELISEQFNLYYRGE
jgi:hypothetical protein